MIYNLKEFGSIFQAIRKSHGFSYKSLYSTSHISMNTLRNIERGKVLPSLDTLSVLSDPLKTDLCALFLTCKKESYMAYDILKEDFLKVQATHTSTSLSSLITGVENLFDDDTLEAYDALFQLKVKQLHLWMLGYKEWVSKKSPTLAMKHLINALQVTHKNFQLETYADHQYNYDELHILFNIGQLQHAEKEGYVILDLDTFLFEKHNDLYEKRIYLFPTLCNNLAVHHLESHNLDQAQYYADIGLEFVKKEQTSVDLPALLICKGIILYQQNSKTFDFYIYLALDSLTFSSQFDILHVALDVLESTYKLPLNYEKYRQNLVL